MIWYRTIHSSTSCWFFYMFPTFFNLFPAGLHIMDTFLTCNIEGFFALFIACIIEIFCQIFFTDFLTVTTGFFATCFFLSSADFLNHCCFLTVIIVWLPINFFADFQKRFIKDVCPQVKVNLEYSPWSKISWEASKDFEFFVWYLWSKWRWWKHLWKWPTSFERLEIGY